MSTLELKNINKIYPNGFHAVHDFNLTIEKGEFIVFVGPSGCGKSTTLRMIAGLEEISSGDFLIDGKRVNELGPREREVAMVFQSYALYPQMTVYDNIAFGLTLQGVDDDVIEKRVMKTAKILGLTEYLDRLPRALSGGQRQRVAIARMLTRKTPIIVFDDSLSAVDTETDERIRTALNADLKGITNIIVSHRITTLLGCDRVLVLENGTASDIGTPQELLQRDGLFRRIYDIQMAIEEESV